MHNCLDNISHILNSLTRNMLVFSKCINIVEILNAQFFRFEC